MLQQRVIQGGAEVHQAIPRFDIYTLTLISGCKKMRCGLNNSCAARILLQSSVELLQSHSIITPILLLERQGLLGHGRTHIVNTFAPALITPIRVQFTPVIVENSRRLLVENRNHEHVVFFGFSVPAEIHGAVPAGRHRGREELC